MKKSIYSLLVIILITTVPAFAQKKNVDAAWRLVGKTESLTEARKLIQTAIEDDVTTTQPRTYYVAGMIEWRSYDADVRKREINPQDASVKDAEMTAKLLNGYLYFMKALPLDSIPDKKGRIKHRYSKEIIDLIDSRSYDLYRAGIICYASGKYYPEAYNSFIAVADLAGKSYMERTQSIFNDSARAKAYYFAGLSAYGGNKPILALHALKRAEDSGINSDTLFLYSMALWEQVARDSTHLTELAKDSLLSISKRAYSIHGIRKPEFLSRMTQIYISENKQDSIIPILNIEIQRSPDEWLPRALRGWVYESQDSIEKAISDYKLAAEHTGVSSKMLMRGAHLLYRTAHSLKEKITGRSVQRRRTANELIENYLLPASSMASRAKEITADSNDFDLINSILHAIDYDISLLK